MKGGEDGGGRGKGRGSERLGEGWRYCSDFDGQWVDFLLKVLHWKQLVTLIITFNSPSCLVKYCYCRRL